MRRIHDLRIKVTKEELANIKAQAEKLGLTVSALIRTLLRGVKIKLSDD